MGNRVVKFRGKRTDNGEWVYGGFYHGVMSETDNPFSLDNARIKTIIIQEGTYYHVAPETIGQYTGLKDKNGTEIFEGDIVNNGERGRYSLGQESWFGGVGGVGVVRYDTKNGCLVINNDDGTTKRLTVKVIKNSRVQVISTIHDKGVE